MLGHNLGSVVIKAAMEKSKLKFNEVDELIMGQVLTAGAGQNPARQAAIQAGLPNEKPAYIVNQGVCPEEKSAVVDALMAEGIADFVNMSL